jgi:radical SAM protein with 4Fe4S-binding SPASM domain
LEVAPIKSVNFGTGESILFPRLIEVIEYLVKRNIVVALTTNGTTVLDLPDAVIQLFHDVDFSLDFPDPRLNDCWRGVGAYQVVMAGIEKCRRLGVETSMVSCLMKENSIYMGALAELAIKLGLNLRVNVYKSVSTRKHQPSYEEFWSAVKDLADAAYFLACSEPVVCAALGMKERLDGSPCGKMSFRIHPDGCIVPCVYLRNSHLTIHDAITDFTAFRRHYHSALELSLPLICQECNWRTVCQGGCTSRRILNHAGEPDEYCFMTHADQPQISARWKASKGLVHEDYLCTMIFSG